MPRQRRHFKRKHQNYHYGTPHAGALALEIAVGVMVTVSLATVFIDAFGNPTTDQVMAMILIDRTIAYLLLLEFVVRLLLSKQRWHFIRRNWWYLLATLPFYTELSEALRAIRLAGLLQLIRTTGHIIFERNQT